MQKVIYLISDVHLGQGRDPATGRWNVLEDFRADDSFCAFMDHIAAENKPVELVIAGDFIEYLQILPELGLKERKDHIGLTEQESLQRTFVVLGQSHVATGHPEIFAALRRFIERGHSITILAGNHDIDLLWPRVWLLMYYNICPPGMAHRLRLKRFHYTVGSASRGRVYIEHGHEHDRANRFGHEMREPFVLNDTGVKHLKRCWGTLFVDKVYNQLEDQCWFIDNIKPISRVVKMGLKGDVVFTATAMALLAKFFLTKGTPMFGGMSFSTLGAGEHAGVPHDAETAVQMVDDDDVRAYLGKRLDEDPSFRAAFESELQKFSNVEQHEMQKMQEGAESLSWVEEPAGEAVDVPGAMSYGLRGAPAEDAYQQAARAVMERDSAISTVIMGHTHQAVDRFPIDLSDGRTGYYFNSGTWTPRLIERSDRPYTWSDLGDSANYTSSLDYVRCVPDEQGAYHVELRSWSAERRG